MSHELNEEDVLALIETGIRAEAADSDIRCSVSTYSEAGVLTMNAGLVVKLDGREYQLTLVRSR